MSNEREKTNEERKKIHEERERALRAIESYLSDKRPNTPEIFAFNTLINYKRWSSKGVLLENEIYDVERKLSELPLDADDFYEQRELDTLWVDRNSAQRHEDNLMDQYSKELATYGAPYFEAIDTIDELTSAYVRARGDWQDTPENRYSDALKILNILTKHLSTSLPNNPEDSAS